MLPLATPAPFLGNSCGLIRANICARVTVRSIQVETFLLQGLHVLYLKVTNRDVHRQCWYMSTCQMYGPRRKVVLDQPGQRQVVERALQMTWHGRIVWKNTSIQHWRIRARVMAPVSQWRLV